MSDAATAIYDGADAVMLLAEPGTGRYPVKAVAMRERIIRSAEGHKLHRLFVAVSEPGETKHRRTPAPLRRLSSHRRYAPRRS